MITGGCVEEKTANIRAVSHRRTKITESTEVQALKQDQGLSLDPYLSGTRCNRHGKLELLLECLRPEYSLHHPSGGVDLQEIML